MLTTYHTSGEYIAAVRQPRELKHLSTWRKRKRIDSVSSGERSGRAQTKKLGFGVTKNHDEEEEVFGMAHLRG